ncbi:hypothetical protein K2173_024524 [Erythroxylum novogranatense]|uniref:Uncharacterized protein n=1 Tax=Erythroxylum novogranatense TaxID=1862640 RepID=A0AAV8SVK4_9ROSI|nr:hypothetical protein K2173_024524 [Erythroxylum novogranatense]
MSSLSYSLPSDSYQFPYQASQFLQKELSFTLLSATKRKKKKHGERRRERRLWFVDASRRRTRRLSIHRPRNRCPSQISPSTGGKRTTDRRLAGIRTATWVM